MSAFTESGILWLVSIRIERIEHIGMRQGEQLHDHAAHRVAEHGGVRPAQLVHEHRADHRRGFAASSRLSLAQVLAGAVTALVGCHRVPAQIREAIEAKR